MKQLISSKLIVSCKSKINFLSLRLDNSFQFLNTSFVMIGLELVFVNICSAISENLLFFSSKRVLICSFSESRLGFSRLLERNEFTKGSPRSHMTDRQGTDLATNFLQKSDKLVNGPLVLLAPEKRALCRWSRHWAPRHASTRASCRWIAPGGRFQWSLSSGNRRRDWVRNLWEGRFWPKGQTPHSAKCQWDIAPMKSPWRKRFRSGFTWKKKHTERNKVRKREKNKQSLRRMTHGWDDAHQHLSQCGRDVGIQRVAPFYTVVFVFFGLGFWVGLVNNGSLRSIRSTCKLDTSTGWESIPLRSSLSRVSLSLNTVLVGEVRAWGRYRMINLLYWRCHWVWRGKVGGRTRQQTRNHDRNEVFRVTLYPNTVFNEMWFLTFDPLVWVSVFIAKLCER